MSSNHAYSACQTWKMSCVISLSHILIPTCKPKKPLPTSELLVFTFIVPGLCLLSHLLVKYDKCALYIRRSILTILTSLGIVIHFVCIEKYEPRYEKIGLRGFRPGPTQTRLYSHRRWLET